MLLPSSDSVTSFPFSALQNFSTSSIEQQLNEDYSLYCQNFDYNPVILKHNCKRMSLQHGYRLCRSLNKAGKKLLGFIFLNLVYLVLEAGYGLAFNHHALVSDAFHLGFGCCVLTVSLLATFQTQAPPQPTFSYGYSRCEVLAAFTNVCFLLFVAFSLAVEALHQMIEPAADHHAPLLLLTSVLNLSVNLLGVWAFRTHARRHLAYRSAQDMNLHAIFLHVVTDSLRSGGTVLVLWLAALGVPAADILVSLLSAALIVLLCLPLFDATATTLLQGTPKSLDGHAVTKWARAACGVGGVLAVERVQVWALHPGRLVASACVTIEPSARHQRVLNEVFHLFTQHLGHATLNLQIETRRA